MTLDNFSDFFEPQIRQVDKWIKTSPYSRLMRLDKPVGIYLVLLPALWAIAFAEDNIFWMLWLFLVFTAGAVVIRGAGCILNDLADIEFDKKVSRTKKRPLASGELSKKEAYKLLFLLLGAGFVLLLTLPFKIIILGLLSIIPIAAYPYFKRFTFYPQVMLGLVFNLGVFMGWYSADYKPSIVPFILYAACFFWTISYDTIYAHQDKEDDLAAGVMSLAIKLGVDTKRVIWKFYLITIILIAITGMNSHMNFMFYLATAVGAYHLYWQVETLDINDPKSCQNKFKSNVQFALIILIGILLGRI